MILQALESRDSVKGECALYVSGSTMAPEGGGPGAEADQADLDRAIVDGIRQGDLGTSSLARLVAGKFNLPRKRVYDRILFLQASESDG